ncbi:MAG: hypothetical protein NT013_22680 [Planctomycetia bacterium]|nr:hypothetical protein [Planctomycetia bacterium]
MSVANAISELHTPVAHSPLANLSTMWTMLRKAHGGPGHSELAAQLEFLRRYQGAVFRFLRTSLRDDDAALEMLQEFALKFVRGDFRSASPANGRFRNFLKTALANQMRDYRAKLATRRKHEVASLDEVAEPNATDFGNEPPFENCWSEELLSRAWTALLHHERSTGQLFYSVLRLRVTNTDKTSPQLAELLTREHNLAPPMSDASFRKALQHAREKFAELLISDIASQLPYPSLEEVEAELIELNLLPYCRIAFAKWKNE